MTSIRSVITTTPPWFLNSVDPMASASNLYISLLKCNVFSQYASSAFRSAMTNEQQDFTTWMWEVALMLKLHPTQLQLLKLSQQTTTANTASTSNSATTENGDTGDKSAAVYRESMPSSASVEMGDVQLPDLSSTGLDPVREAVQREGLIGYYVALNITNIGSE